MTTVDHDRVIDLLGREPGDFNLLGYADAAVAVVDARVPSLPAATKNMIADHLTAHYLEQATFGDGRGLTAKRIGDASWQWSAEAIKDLSSTRNGRIAMELDTTGALGEASKPKPHFAVLG